MANNKQQSTPIFVIDVCSTSNDQKEPHSLPRSSSLLNNAEIYKDLSGIIHHRSNNLLYRSYSCPNNSFSNENTIPLQTSSTTINLGMKFLDPYNGLNSPEGSSSRYSLYGSYFNLSESGYHPSLNRSLTVNGRPLLIPDKSSKYFLNTYQDKCNNWLRHLN